ncbi:MAG: hypothetical protein IKP20_02335 [Candidatus Methanomethylophilaceae archaeon]|nr:hypothetical protein [Candidatus Methanomethylophilaceae archaeon]
MITIGRPTIQKNKVTSKIVVDNNEHECFFEIEVKYEGGRDWVKKMKPSEDCDPFLISLLPGAIKHHHDIVCEGDVSEDLLFNIRNIFIPAVVKYDRTLSEINVVAKSKIAAKSNRTQKMTGAGLSMGIDSLYVLEKYGNSEDSKIDCSFVFDVGDFNVYRNHDKTEDYLLKKVEKLVNEIDLPLVYIKSNIASIFPGERGTRLTYYHIACVNLVKKFIGRYYSATTYTIQDLDLVNNSKGGEYAEMFLATVFSTKEVSIFPLPVEASRIEKTIELADYEIAQKYLHVCMREPFNCGLCKKCRRTLTTLDLIGKLDNFSDVFNIDYYKKNRSSYFEWLQLNAQNNDYYCKDILQLAEKKKCKYLKDKVGIQVAIKDLFQERHSINNKAEYTQNQKKWKKNSKQALKKLSDSLAEGKYRSVMVYGDNYSTDMVNRLLEDMGIKIHSAISTTSDLISLMNQNDSEFDAVVVCNSTSYSIGIVKEIMFTYDKPVIYLDDCLRKTN